MLNWYFHEPHCVRPIWTWIEIIRFKMKWLLAPVTNLSWVKWFVCNLQNCPLLARRYRLQTTSLFTVDCTSNRSFWKIKRKSFNNFREINREISVHFCEHQTIKQTTVYWNGIFYFLKMRKRSQFHIPLDFEFNCTSLHVSDIALWFDHCGRFIIETTKHKQLFGKEKKLIGSFPMKLRLIRVFRLSITEWNDTEEKQLNDEKTTKTEGELLA